MTELPADLVMAETARERYLRRRAAYATAAQRPDLWPTVDRWPLYVGLGNLARTLVLQEALLETLRTPGDIVEFGAWHGATTLLWAKLLTLWAPGTSKRVHAFDRWEGGFEPAQWTAADAPHAAPQYAGTYRGELDVLQQMLDLYDLTERVVLHQGLIEGTWPCARTSIARVSLVLLDVDLYAPTRAALDGLHERTVPGTLILADEYGHPDWPGETAAVDEFLSAHPGAYEVRGVTQATQPTLVLRRKEG